MIMRFFLYFWIQLLYLREEWKIRKFWGRQPQFTIADSLLKKHYRWANPYRICRQFFETQKHCKDPYVYGDTPLTTLHRIATLSGLNEKDVAVDLGCGTGRGAFFLQSLFQCQVIGIEIVPTFTEIARQVAAETMNSKVSFLNQDIVDVSLEDASWIYFDATISDEDFLRSVVNNFQNLSPGAKILSVNADLREYSISKDAFELVAIFQARYFWGSADVFFLQKLG